MWRAYTTGLHGCSCTGVFHDSSSCIYIPVHVCVVSSHYCKDAVGSLHWPGHTKQTLQIDQFPNTLAQLVPVATYTSHLVTKLL